MVWCIFKCIYENQCFYILPLTRHLCLRITLKVFFSVCSYACLSIWLSFCLSVSVCCFAHLSSVSVCLVAWMKSWQLLTMDESRAELTTFTNQRLVAYWSGYYTIAVVQLYWYCSSTASSLNCNAFTKNRMAGYMSWSFWCWHISL